MKRIIYTAIATLLFLVSSCTLEQEVYNKINPGCKCASQCERLSRVLPVGDF